MTTPISLDLSALRAACREVASGTLWQPSDPELVHDVVTASDTLDVRNAFYEIATEEANFLSEADVDPNLVTRAIRYLAHVHAMPVMQRDVVWFRNMLEILIGLANPDCCHTPESAAIFGDIEAGISVARSKMEKAVEG